jgi:hypothetical protein
MAVTVDCPLGQPRTVWLDRFPNEPYRVADARSKDGYRGKVALRRVCPTHVQFDAKKRKPKRMNSANVAFS